MNHRRLLLLAIMLLLSVGVVVSPATVSIVQASDTCYTYDVRPVDLGGGSWNDRNYFLDVHGTTRDDGDIYQQSGRYWFRLSFHPNSLTPDGDGVRFGVSTAWAYTHPGWRHYNYVYAYPC